MDQGLLSEDIISEVLQLHDERIRQYTNVLQDMPTLEAGLKSILRRIIEAANKCREELYKYSGKIINAFNTGQQVGTAIISIDKKIIVADCLAELKLVLRIYSSAISFSATNESLMKILQLQEERMKQLYLHVMQFHDAL